MVSKKYTMYMQLLASAFININREQKLSEGHFKIILEDVDIF